MELHRLLIDIRRRTEHEVTFEGKEKRSKSGNFLY
jgi:ribosomal protein L13E